MMNSDDVDRQLKNLTRRGFITMAAAAGAGYASWKFLRTRPHESGIEWPLRNALQTNEKLAEAYFSRQRLSPSFRPSDLTRARINGRLGLQAPVDLDAWRLNIEGASSAVALTLDDIRALPRHEQITELRCIEGWSIIVKWTGARLADLIANLCRLFVVLFLFGLFHFTTQADQLRRLIGWSLLPARPLADMPRLAVPCDG